MCLHFFVNERKRAKPAIVSGLANSHILKIICYYHFMSISKKNLSLIEIAAVVAVAVLIGVGVWSIVYKNSMTSTDGTAVVNEPVTAEAPEVYNRTTAVPSDWKTYQDAEYPISVAYPSGWLVVPDSGGNPTMFDYEIGMGMTQQNFEVVIGMNKKPLEERVTQFKNDFLNNGAVHPKLLSEKAMVIDGRPATEVRYRQMSGTPGQQVEGPIERQYFVFANDVTYTFPVVRESDRPFVLSANDSLIMFESIDIN